MAASTAWKYRAYQSQIAGQPEVTTWIQIDLGSMRRIESVKLYPSHTVQSPGLGFPVRFRIECSPDAECRLVRAIADFTEADHPDPGDHVVEFNAREATGRYVRLTAVRLRARKRPNLPVEFPSAREATFLLALAKIAVMSRGVDIAEQRPVTVDARLGLAAGAQQITRPMRPQGEGIVTDNPGNVIPADEWKPASGRASAPDQGVTLDGGLFQAAVGNNIDYLLSSFSTDDLLRQFRQRAGQCVPDSEHTPHPFWEEDLGGSNAGRFLMGAANTLHWMEHPQLRERLNAVVDGIAECRQPNGYIMGYPEESIFLSERGAYTRAWTTLGLIEAGRSGNVKAFELLCGYYDWFNRHPDLPQLLRGCGQGGQGMVANTQLYFTPVGLPADIHVIQRYFQENYWLEDLAKRKREAIWQYPYDRPHCYLLANIEAYLDLYQATGDGKYLDAVDGAWELYHENWEQVGGSISIIEAEIGEPKSNKLYAWLGETCGSVFWVRLNHRLHALRPDEEKYAAEIEKSIYNVILANQDGAIGIRYHSMLVGKKEPATRVNTCCEGQGTRLLGSLPEYIYWICADGLYVNMFEASTIECSSSGEPLSVTMRTAFPRDHSVELAIETATPQRLALHIRMPSWAAGNIAVQVNGLRAASGKPGTYLKLEQLWRGGDKISFVLPMAFKLTRYEGTDQIVGQHRFALEYGPLLMAAIGAAERRLLLFLADGQPADILGRLQQDPQNPLHFLLVGSMEFFETQVRLIPYFEVTDQSFSCFPSIESRAGIFS